MRRFLIMAMMVLALGMSGCSGENPKDLFDTAKLEELQNNPAHARELYQKIIAGHPDSEYAEKAKKRLQAME